nr:serine:threonine protein phosphatase with [Hymenolepis microstoma]
MKEPETCISIKAALLIQRWYRRHQAEVEMRRRCAWKIYEFFEYTGADDQRHILDSELVSEVLDEATAVLQVAPNIQRVSTALVHQITICGDLHGQIEDLSLIFEMNGLPDIFNPYIFNGDFVDRGSNSLEVLVILLTCLIAHPSAVFLNRGNHEDPLLNKRYGFVDEIRSKYPKQSKRILKQIEALFCSIPLCTILDDVILICHGGISRTTDLSKIMKIDRKMFSSVLQPILEGENAVSVDDWRQVLDMLWSDPQVAPGCKPNIKRGGGSYFGPDVTANLLNHLKIGVLIRSHECCPNGWKMDHNNQVLTVFSASNYYGPDSNLGAFIQIFSKREVGTPKSETKISILGPVECEITDLSTAQAPGMDSRDTISSSNSASVVYTRVIKQLNTSANNQKQVIETRLIPRLVTFRAGRSRKLQTALEKRHSNDAAYRMLLRRILSKKATIIRAMQDYDTCKTGEVTITQWCTVMLKHAGQNLPWRILRYSLVKASPTHPKTHVLYMSMFDPKHEIFSESIRRKFTSENYTDLDELVSIFKQFDVEDNGFVSVDQFKEKCKKLYADKCVAFEDSTINKLAILLDFNSDGIIDFNEFIEGSRLVKENCEFACIDCSNIIR